MIELGPLDARVARASAALQRGSTSPSPFGEPLDDYRDVAGKTTYDALRELEPGPIHEAHRDALVRWVAYFTDARIGWELVLEEKKREIAEDPALQGVAADRLAHLSKTWTEARAALLRAPNFVEIDKALQRLDELADPIVAVRRERRSRSIEIAHRLGIPSGPEEAFRTAILSLANAVLDATEPLARDWQKRIGGTPALVIESAFAREANEGWPARLAPRWLEDAFKVIAPRTPNNVPLPEAIGGASFLRATADWGHALRVGSTAKSLPFALARDPAPTEAFLYGDLLALAVASRPFQRRKLGLSVRSAEAQERLLARTLFVELRERAALTVASGDAEEAEHLTSRIYGRPLPRSLATAWAHGGISGEARADAAERFVASLRAYVLYGELVAMNDEDWFDNPRAGQRLGHIASGPIRQSETPDAAVATNIARRFEEALG